ncbi:putative RNA-binding protein isoform 1 [Schistosoma japonicum]|uniref:Putative RNA-binding protein isoform 1 n=2 Tax=Schistosoma japonicum TaxID=6182 RepID=A0A4Z2CW94_SCHJA|nr:putative RNA-binding protein isoform 1 [Schistosoma japonicum]TNN08543.1 putative RNA-binding protein isoform 1 [Schistosoma japonicum]
MVLKTAAHVAKVKGLSREVKIKDVKKFFKPIRIKDFRVLKNGIGIAFFRNDRDLSEALKKKGSVCGRAVRIEEHVRENQETTTEQKSAQSSWPVKTSEETVSAILETGRLFVRNLPYDCTENELEKLFSPYGPLSDIHLAFDSWSQVSKGFAFVTYLFPSDAVKAYKSLDKTKFMDRLIHILPGQEHTESNHSFRKSLNNSHGNENSTDSPKMFQSSFQNDRFQELKKSSNIGHNWNALFIRPDAVATYLAAKFGLTMEQVLDPSGNKSVAVRLAHGETQLVAEMKEFLKTHGVRLEAFEKYNDDADVKETGDTSIVHETSGQRSRLEAKSKSAIRQLSGTAFLIKNLPAGTTEFEVRDLLKRYTKSAVNVDSNTPPIRSGLKRVLVPPLGITAIVEYTHPQQARWMYKALAYEPFRDSVLFLQWLPDGALKSSLDDNKTEEIISRKSKKVIRKQSSIDKVEKTEQSDDEFELITSIPTGKHKLKEETLETSTAVDQSPSHDNEASSIQTSQYKRTSKKHLNKKQKIEQHMKESVESRPLTHQSKLIKFTSDKTDDSFNAQPNVSIMKNDIQDATITTTNEHDEKINIKKSKSSKQFNRKNNVLIVRNIPFQATQKELVELFRPIGGLVNVRLPNKATGGHRGFAFIEFDTLDKAKIALETLGIATHLLGRRLLLEYAQK